MHRFISLALPCPFPLSLPAINECKADMRASSPALPVETLTPCRYLFGYARNVLRTVLSDLMTLSLAGFRGSGLSPR